MAYDAIAASLVAKETELKTLDRPLSDVKAPVGAIDLARLTQELEIVGGSLNVLHRTVDDERRDPDEALGVRVDYDASASSPVGRASIPSMATAQQCHTRIVSQPG